MYIYIHIYIYVYMYISISISIYTCLHVWIWLCVFLNLQYSHAISLLFDWTPYHGWLSNSNSHVWCLNFVKYQQLSMFFKELDREFCYLNLNIGSRSVVPTLHGFCSLEIQIPQCVWASEVPLRLINVQLRTVLAVGGVGGLAVGLALQNLVQNLISGPPG